MPSNAMMMASSSSALMTVSRMSIWDFWLSMNSA